MHHSCKTRAAVEAAYAEPGGVPGVFSRKAADYAAARPAYPPALFDALRRIARLAPQALIADVGAGTGLLTRGLLDAGWQVLAIEPSAPMRAAADAALGGRAGYRSAQGRAEAMPLADGTADLVTAAQAFHWFELEAARRECLRVLNPEGQVALIWNDRVPQDPLNDALQAVFERFGGAKLAALVGQEDRSRVGEFFGHAPPVHESWPNEQLLDLPQLCGLVFSRSYMPARESAEGEQVAQALAALFERLASNGRVTMRYRTMAFIGRPA